ASVALWDSFRLLRFRRFSRAIGQFVIGLPGALRLRRPISELTLRRYDALRFRSICAAEDYADPPALRLRDIWTWFVKSWWNRPRNRSFWDQRQGDVGGTFSSKFAHELGSSDDAKGPPR